VQAKPTYQNIQLILPVNHMLLINNNCANNKTAYVHWDLAKNGLLAVIQDSY